MTSLETPSTQVEEANKPETCMPSLDPTPVQEIDRCQRHKLNEGCVLCGKPNARRCGTCHVATYCSVECQTEAWPVHQHDCTSNAGNSHLKTLSDHPLLQFKRQHPEVWPYISKTMIASPHLVLCLDPKDTKTIHFVFEAMVTADWFPTPYYFDQFKRTCALKREDQSVLILRTYDPNLVWICRIKITPLCKERST